MFSTVKTDQLACTAAACLDLLRHHAGTRTVRWVTAAGATRGGQVCKGENGEAGRGEYRVRSSCAASSSLRALHRASRRLFPCSRHHARANALRGDGAGENNEWVGMGALAIHAMNSANGSKRCRARTWEEERRRARSVKQGAMSLTQIERGSSLLCPGPPAAGP